LSFNLDIHWSHGLREPATFEAAFFPLLDEIEATGSLRTAARNLGISYRYAWGLLRTWTGRIGQPVVELQRGRGARLTALGEKLLWEQRRINARLGPELESLASELNSGLDALAKTSPQSRLRIYASHGLALGVLRDLVNATKEVHMDLQYRGSLESLRLFRAGKCDIAGFHFPYGNLAMRLAPRYRHLLDPDQHVLLNVVNREQGIITAAGNPKKIRSLSDLTRRNISFINREPAAGTRVIFDALIEGAGIEAGSIQGYDNEEFTHTAVAAIVASGAVDAGFGIRAAAEKMGLNFILMVRERYLFVMRREALHTAPIVKLCRILRGVAFRKAANSLPGYDADDAGNPCALEELFG
jgi:putative molybdopterin biosynthesis protein